MAESIRHASYFTIIRRSSRVTRVTVLFAKSLIYFNKTKFQWNLRRSEPGLTVTTATVDTNRSEMKNVVVLRLVRFPNLLRPSTRRESAENLR